MVTKLEDTNDGFCDTDCSLREAIATAAPSNTITFDTALSDETIHLASMLTLSKSVTIDGSALDIPITISGDTNNDGIGNVRVFSVNS
jgi:CSLREA domain-containing protein